MATKQQPNQNNQFNSKPTQQPNQPCSMMRTKQRRRDYTIPVRLNQLPPPTKALDQEETLPYLVNGASEVAREKCWLWWQSREMLKETTSKQEESNSGVWFNIVELNQHNKKPSECCCQVNIMSELQAGDKINQSLIDQISIKRTTKKLAQSSISSSVVYSVALNYRKMLLVAIVALIAIQSSNQICHCDTSQPYQQERASDSSGGSHNNVIGSSLSSGGGSSAATTPLTSTSLSPASLKQSPSTPLAAAAAATTTTTSSSSKSKPLIEKFSANHREHILSILSDSIERQHLKIKPVRAFVKQQQQQQRPSKFDSGDEFNDDLSNFVATNFIIQKSSANKGGGKQQQQMTNSGIGSIKTQDGAMGEILRMHEIANNRLQIPKLAPEKGSSEQLESSASSRWREIARAPVRVASNLVNPNKVVSQVLSYLTPLVAPKIPVASILGFGKHLAFPNLTEATNSVQIAQQQNNAIVEQAPLVPVITTVPEQTQPAASYRIRLNPFIGRSIKQSPIVSGSNNYNYQKSPEREPSQVSSFSKSYNSFLPQTLYINNIGSSGSVENLPHASTVSNNGGQLKQHQQSSRIFGKLDGNSPQNSAGDSDQPPLKLDLYAKDLMMADTNLHQSTTMAAASLSSLANGTKFSQQQQQHDTGNQISKTTTTTKGSRNSTGHGSWSKNPKRINQVAHNYLQDSLRDLLTLSQLPILSDRPVSTAPSVLERPKGSLKQQRPTSSATDHKLVQEDIKAQNQRKRALDELYRFAYILATGVRRKKDPLTALESNPVTQVAPPLKKGVHTQRSINKFLAANRNQLLNYARKFKSNLKWPRSNSNENNKFKPRGVMWDMATDPSLAVTVFHLLERASVALPLGFLLMPFVQMIKNPLNGINFGRILPAKATHRSVDYEELAKQLDFVDKMLSRALRPTHREATFMGR